MANYSDIWRSYYQKKATTGVPLTSSEMRRAEAPILDDAYRRWRTSQEMNQRNADREFQKQVAEDQARAANVAGITQAVGTLGGLALGGYGLYRYLNPKPPTYAPTSGETVLSPSTYSTMTPLAPTAAPVGPPPVNVAGPAWAEAPFTPSAASPTPLVYDPAAGGGSTILGSGAGGGGVVAPSAAAGGGAPPPVPGSAIGPMFTGAGLVHGAYTYGPPLLQKAGVSQEYSTPMVGGSSGVLGHAAGKAAESLTGSKAAGQAVEWAVNPIGSAVSTAVDFINNLF